MNDSGTHRLLKGQKQWRGDVMRYALVTLLLATGVCAVSVRAEAAAGDVEAKFRTLRVALSYGDTEAKLGAIRAVAQLGRNGEGAAGLLVKALSDSDRNVRLAAVDALGKIGPSTTEVVVAMTKLVGGKDGDAADAAVNVLRLIGPGAAPAIDALLLKYAEGKDGKARDSIIDALGMIGPAAHRAVPMLIRTFKKSSDYNLRSRVAYALGNIGQPIETVVPALIVALADDHCNVRAGGARGLGKIGPKAAKAQAALRKALKDTNPAVASRAVWALGRLGASDEQTIAALIGLLSSSQDYALAAAALGKAGKPGIDALVKRLGSPDAVWRLLAVRALGQIGYPAAAAAPAVKKATADKDANVRRAAALALKKIVEAPPARCVNVLAVSGKHTLVCKSRWHNVNGSWAIEGKVNISGIEALAMIKPNPAEGKYDLPKELAASLGERLLKAAQFTPAQKQELGRWLGSGKRNKKFSSTGAIMATSKTHTAPDGTSQVEISLKGRIEIELIHHLTNRYGPNWNEAKWSIDILGQLTVDSTTGRTVKANITAAGQSKGLYHTASRREDEPYTETFKLTLTPETPPKAK